MSSLQVSSTDNESLSIQWEHPGEECTLLYNVEVILTTRDQCEAETNGQRIFRNVTTISTRVPNLEAFSTYLVYVKGISAFSESVIVDEEIVIGVTMETGE